MESEVDIFSHDIMMRAPPLENPVLATETRKLFPRFIWDISPQVRESFFDPTRPLGIQLLGQANGTVELVRGLTLGATLEGNIVDNFQTNRSSDSLLPHVRSDFLQYFTKGKNGIAFLGAGYEFRVSRNVFANIRAGYLESMFAGVGGEVLWRPEGQRWALGADLYEVQQRDFDRLFGLQHYRVATGHVSLYYDSPWYDLNFAVRAGQYLAGDRGLTVEATRRFDTGIEIGAFFTKTNVPALQFGEGSFDKGIIIRIPLNWALPLDTQSQIGLDLRPVQRDGGQRLYGDTTLYDQTRRDSLGEMDRALHSSPD
jgi:Exopolysaccharide biosynthesis protein YbjH